MHGDFIDVRVADSGPGPGQQKTADEGAGVGLQNIRDRLQMRYGDAAELSLGTADIGELEVALKLPAQGASG